MSKNPVVPAVLIVALGAVAQIASAQPIPGDPAPQMNRVLGYASMKNVAIELASFRLDETGNTAMAYDVVREILRGYDATQPNQDVERHVSAALRRYDTPHHHDRVFLANVAHMIWLEWRLHGDGEEEIVELRDEPHVPGATTTFAFPRAHLGWSLRDYSTALVDDHLLGELWRDPNNLTTAPSSALAQHHYNFKHFKNAQRVLDRMVPFHPDVQWDHKSAVARLVEFSGDHFGHDYTGWGAATYTGRPSFAGGEDLDLSEIYQRRLGGCGMIAAVSSLLARSLNIPAAEDRPRIIGPNKNSVASHDHAYFPTLIDPWIHGDSVVRPGGMGLLADPLFMSRATVAQQTYATMWQLSYDLHRAARRALHAKWGLEFAQTYNFRRSPDQVRSFYADNGFTSANLNRAYFEARYGHMNPALVVQSHTKTSKRIVIPTQKYELLDEVAAHWPLDDTQSFEDAMLPRTDGHARGNTLKSTASRNGRAIRFDGTSYIEVDDRPVLRRNDEELTISVMVRPDADAPAGRIFTREISGMPQGDALVVDDIEDDQLEFLVETEPTFEHELTPYRFAYKLDITSDRYLRFQYQRESDGTVFTLLSANPIRAGRWSHVVVTYDATDHARIWVDGTKVAEEPAAGHLPMAYTYKSYSLYYSAYPARTTIGDGFRGDLDEVVLQFGALEKTEIQALRQRFVP